MGDSMMGSILGLDEFLKALDERVKPEFQLNHEEVINDLINAATEGESEIVGCLIVAEFTKKNQSINFSFAVTKEDGVMMIIYMGVEEL